VLPWGFISENGVEDREELSGNGDQDDHFWLSGRDEALIEGSERRVAACPDQRGHEEGRAHAGSPTAGEALAAPFAGLPGPRRQARETCDFSAREGSQLGQFGQERTGDNRSHAGNTLQQVFLLPPHRRTANGVVDAGVEYREFLFEGLDETGCALLQHTAWKLAFPLPLRHDHLDDLPASGDKLRQQAGIFIGQRPDFRFGGFHEAGDHGGVDRIGLGSLAQSLSEGAHLSRIDHDNRQTRTTQARGHHRLKPASRLHRHRVNAKRRDSGNQRINAVGVPRDGKRLTSRVNMHIQSVLRDVDADNDGFHLHPSLHNRASLPAAQATVRVRWNDERRASLPTGFQCPRGLRSSARHRIGNLIRSGTKRVTRGPRSSRQDNMDGWLRIEYFNVGSR